MTRKLFGTDGLRGQVNIPPMTPEIALKLGQAAGQYFRKGARRHKVIIGKDTRLSGYVFETALTSGLCAAGMDVYLVGPLPTPAIAFLTRNMRADLGVVISASHNPFMDNGIKFFDHNGFKLPDELPRNRRACFGRKSSMGKAEPEIAARLKDALGRYVVYLKNSFPQDVTLDGLQIVLDLCSNAAYSVAPTVLEELGATVIMPGVNPNGLNINHQCGSLYPEMYFSNGCGKRCRPWSCA